jgi:hypothetical protein
MPTQKADWLFGAECAVAVELQMIRGRALRYAGNCFHGVASGVKSSLSLDARPMKIPRSIAPGTDYGRIAA